jgi:hypothetical protein
MQKCIATANHQFNSIFDFTSMKSDDAITTVVHHLKPLKRLCIHGDGRIEHLRD